MMDSARLESLVRTTLAAAFAHHESVWSGLLYQQLTTAGHAVGEETLLTTLEALRGQGYVRLSRPRSSDADAQQHGAVGISRGPRYREL
jgi:hypothetical protein